MTQHVRSEIIIRGYFRVRAITKPQIIQHASVVMNSKVCVGLKSFLTMTSETKSDPFKSVRDSAQGD